MTLTPGVRFDTYEIVAPIGAGGMGEVYRAHDSKLAREVAIKVLSGRLAADAAARSRFEREAKALAALPHPNIVAVHGVGESAVEGTGTVHYAVMELVEGETLRHKLGPGPLPPRRALDYALQIARGLAAAHQKGIVHRDLKPENVIIAADGRVKILDFGLALINSPLGDAPAAEPMSTVRQTAPGVVLGTVAYMSPEQVRGLAVGPESDLFSLGVVLYEMLTGYRPFRGDAAADVMGAILRDDPKEFPSALALPPTLDRIVRRCLEKAPGERFGSAKDLAFTLEALLGSTTTTVPADTHRDRRRRVPVTWAALATAAGLALGLTQRLWTSPEAAVSSAPMYTSVVLAEGEALFTGPDEISKTIALSPDGDTLVYEVSGSDAPLVAYTMNTGRRTRISGTEQGRSPFFAPTGDALLYWISPGGSQPGSGPKLYRIPRAGGSPRPLCDVFAPTGASWGDDGTIVYAPTFDSGLWRTSATGSACEALIPLTPVEGSHVWPEVLPGSKAVLYTAEVDGRLYSDARIMVKPLPAGEPRLVLEGGTAAAYVRSGHLVFGRSNTLMAAPFDLATQTVTAPAVPVVDGVSESLITGTVRFSVSNTGVLAYVAGGGSASLRHLAWVDRSGRSQRLGTAGRNYNRATLSPDTRQLALQIDGANNDLWVFDLERDSLTRVTTRGENFNPVWTPDGSRLVFRSNRSGTLNLFATEPNGDGAVQQLTEFTTTPVGPALPSVSPDGSVVAFVRVDPQTTSDVWLATLGEGRTARPLIRTPFQESNPRISPNGQVVAYQSNESQRFEVYVQSLAGRGGRRQVSANGGSSPIWSRDGKELFFLSGTSMMVARVSVTPTLTSSRPDVLFTGIDRYLSEFDVAPDGRFLMIERSVEETSTREIKIITNFFDILNRLAPHPAR